MLGNKELPKFGPLQGVKVLHATVSAGPPLAPLFYSGFGADVIWMENAKAPDLWRATGCYTTDAERYNQRTIALDLATEEGKDVFRKLIAEVDVFMENSKGGAYAKMGFSDEELWKINPALVIGHASGFGQFGDPAFVNRPSYDTIAQAFSGYTWMNRNDVTNPYAVGPYAGDVMTGMFLAVGTLSALIRARETGIGDSIDVAQYEALLKVCGMSGVTWFTEHKDFVATGQPETHVAHTACPTKDGSYIQVQFVGSGPLKKAVEFFGFEYGTEEFPKGWAVGFIDTPGGRKLEDAILEFCASHTAAECEEIFLSAGLPCSKLNSFADLEVHPHVIARDIIKEFENFKGQKVRWVEPLPKFTKNPTQIWRPAPFFGMDNEQILSELGYTEEEVAKMYEKGAIAHDPEGKMSMPYVKFGA